jgi:nitrous oxide reductase
MAYMPLGSEQIPTRATVWDGSKREKLLSTTSVSFCTAKKGIPIPYTGCALTDAPRATTHAMFDIVVARSWI